MNISDIPWCRLGLALAQWGATCMPFRPHHEWKAGCPKTHIFPWGDFISVPDVPPSSWLPLGTQSIPKPKCIDGPVLLPPRGNSRMWLEMSSTVSNCPLQLRRSLMHLLPTEAALLRAQRGLRWAMLPFSTSQPLLSTTFEIRFLWLSFSILCERHHLHAYVYTFKKSKNIFKIVNSFSGKQNNNTNLYYTPLRINNQWNFYSSTLQILFLTYNVDTARTTKMNKSLVPALMYSRKRWAKTIWCTMIWIVIRVVQIMEYDSSLKEKEFQKNEQ